MNEETIVEKKWNSPPFITRAESCGKFKRSLLQKG
jgi:hypothetical protein